MRADPGGGDICAEVLVDPRFSFLNDAHHEFVDEVRVGTVMTGAGTDRKRFLRAEGIVVATDREPPQRLGNSFFRLENLSMLELSCGHPGELIDPVIPFFSDIVRNNTFSM